MFSPFPPLGGFSILIFFRKNRIHRNILKILLILSKFFFKNRIHSSIFPVILRVLPRLTFFCTMAGLRIGVAKQAIVVAGLQTVRTDVDRYFAAASGLYALARVFFEG